MDPVTAGLMGGSIASNVYGNIATNSANKHESRTNRDFQERMSSTAYQRAKIDMEAAGLNPALMFGSGSAASTPSGDKATMENPGPGITAGINTGLQAQTVKAQSGNLQADTENKKVQNSVLANETRLQGGSIQQQAMTNKVLKETLDAQIKKAKAEGDYSELNQIMGVINSGASSAGQLMPKLKIQLPGRK